MNSYDVYESDAVCSLKWVAESKQLGDIFHFTRVPALICILQEDKLAASREFGTRFISFTRDKSFRNNTLHGKNLAVRIAFNGSAMSENYKIRPFNYWYNRGKQLNAPDKYMKQVHARDFGRNEAEERLILKGSYELKNIKRYITGIEILMDSIVNQLSVLDPSVIKAMSYVYPNIDFSNLDPDSDKDVYTWRADVQENSNTIFNDVLSFILKKSPVDCEVH